MPMHKRILCVLLTALILLSLIPAVSLPVQAASDMKTSEKCIAILKKMEGFVEFPIYDNGQYSVGYGSGCDKDDYPDGITEEEADQLLREYLAGMEKTMNDFANRHGILFSQNQFDALMLFTYNCGPNWVYGDGEFRQAVLDNVSGNTFLYYITQWTAASAQLHMGLVNRRLIEADMYLNGSYTNVKPSNYTYVLYDNNEGVGQVRVQGYDCNLSACVQPTPTREGYKFLGWYTAAQKGRWVTKLSVSNAEQTLYAHWQEADATPDTAPAAAYGISGSDLVSLKVYDAPNGKQKGTLREDGTNVIRAEYVDASGVKWGKLSSDNWVKLGDPCKGAWEEVQEDNGVKVTVTGDYVNVRIGPGTDYKVVSSVKEKDEIVITQVCDVNGVLWGRFRGGWICLEYTDYSGGITPTPKPEQSADQEQTTEAFTATGVVTADQLNIRATAGTHGYVMGVYNRGDKVQIIEKTMVGNVPWGRTNRGWICLTYVQLDGSVQEPEATEPETNVPETTVPETTTPGKEEQQPAAGSGEGIPATVISNAGLNIRAGAGTNFATVGAYKSGAKISILEQKTVDGVTWGRTDKGWVSMQYVKLDEYWSNTAGVYGVVTSATGLNIRAGAGVGYAPVGNYQSGQRIVILEQTVVGGQKWGRTDKGWVCMAYVRLEEAVVTPEEQPTPETTVPETTAPETTEPEATKPENSTGGKTGVITAGGLNVRATPGTAGAIVGGYQKGDKVTILETTVVNGTTWGRTDKGWIHMGYVKLDNPEADTEVDAEMGAGSTGVVTAGSLCIRKGPGTANAILGTYSRGDVVKILETAKVGTTTWGRTDKGWICMDYVQAVAVPDEGTDNEPTEEPETEKDDPDNETAETTEPEEDNSGHETEETPGTEETEPVSAFGFTGEAFVAALNAELEAYDIVAKAVDSGMEGIMSFEFVAISENRSYGVMMDIELAADSDMVAGIVMVCDAASEIATENLIAFSVYTMTLVDDTITEADIEAMMSNSQVDEDGNQYYIMVRESGEFAFVLAGELLYFYGIFIFRCWKRN